MPTANQPLLLIHLGYEADFARWSRRILYQIRPEKNRKTCSVRHRYAKVHGPVSPPEHWVAPLHWLGSDPA
jgi:hypothetical protein